MEQKKRRKNSAIKVFANELVGPSGRRFISRMKNPHTRAITTARLIRSSGLHIRKTGGILVDTFTRGVVTGIGGGVSAVAKERTIHAIRHRFGG